MHLACPECGGTVFMRAVRLVQFSPSWLPWWPPHEKHYGHNAACDGCGLAVKITLNGTQRLRTKVLPVAPTPPKDDGPKPKMELHATPEHVWNRGSR